MTAGPEATAATATEQARGPLSRGARNCSLPSENVRPGPHEHELGLWTRVPVVRKRPLRNPKRLVHVLDLGVNVSDRVHRPHGAALRVDVTANRARVDEGFAKLLRYRAPHRILELLVVAAVLVAVE